MKSKTALVTGATGAIGPVLAAQLLQAGYAVRAMSRTTPLAGMLPEAVSHIKGHITDSAMIECALDGVDTVFHLAGLLHIENPGPNSEAAYPRINVDGARLIAEASANAGVKRLIYFSTVKVYGTRQRTPVVGECAPRSATLYACSKLGGEKTVKSIKYLDCNAVEMLARPHFACRGGG